ncbi:MAG: hypothetical protein ACI8RD_007617 [Bacillariaceae sp.]|jgi:hypothetical protein
MGRFTSVQGFADNNSNNRSITYDQAKGGGNGGGGGGDNKGSGGGSGGGGGDKKLKVERVVNPYGSVSGAGSGEFHVYRHARARETARWKDLDERAQLEEDEQNFTSKIQTTKLIEETKTSKNRRKRQREKEAKKRKKHLTAAGIIGFQGDDNDNEEEQEEQFAYVPISKQQKTSGSENDKATTRIDSTTADSSSIPNDGSFLEMMKQKLEQENQQKISDIDNNKATGTTTTTKEDDNTNANDSDDDEEGPALPPSK